MPNLSETRRWRDPIAVVLVSFYLVGVGIFLVLTRRIVAPPFLRVFRALARRPYAGAVSSFTQNRAIAFMRPCLRTFCRILKVPHPLMLFEDGRPLGPAHAPHDQMRALGGGRFSHWGAHLFFTTSDNSDPRSNGRRYTVREMRRSAVLFIRATGWDTGFGQPDYVRNCRTVFSTARSS